MALNEIVSRVVRRKEQEKAGNSINGKIFRPLSPEELGFQRVDAGAFPEEPVMVEGVSPQQMKQWVIAPLEAGPDGLRVAMATPQDLYLRKIIEDSFGQKVIPFYAEPEDITTVLYKWYEAELDLDGTADEELDEEAADGLWDDPEQLRDLASEAPVVRLVNHLINRALEVGASDIHFEPFRENMKVRFRIDGVLHDMETISKRLQPAITSRLKLMAKMNIAEMRLPQDGRIKVKDGRRETDIRVSSLPTIFGESVVLRLLNREEVRLDLDTLGIPQDILADFSRLITRPYGMILVTGPTGSGKTTTLYSVMNRINSPDKKIVTVEDPVEYQLDGINQIQVRPDIGLNFASALRSILRQDPDVILIGEIRDAETAEIAVQSSLTGHLVFSTLHTNDAAGAVTRLNEMGVEPYLISSSLLAVMAQRLVRKVCPHCSQEEVISPAFRQEAAAALGVELQEIPERAVRGQGCNSCAGTGYSGRAGIYELIEIKGEQIPQLIINGSSSREIASAAVAQGMRTLRQDGLRKVSHGITTLEEVVRVTS